ncbi:MAG: hypothetical protein KGJ90_00120 [Patescibacteria group bacterium]|nr:hypothetical protein [Patescibacteria group bacterium]
MMHAKQANPCSDCVDGYCTMNCGPAMTNREMLVTNLRGLELRMQGRVEAIEDRDGKESAVTGRGIGIGYLLARDIAKALAEAAAILEEPDMNKDYERRPSWDDQFKETSWERQERQRKARLKARSEKPLDPRDPDPSRPGIFRDHNCWKCKDGTELSKCPTPNRPGNCGYPHARND